MKIAVANGEEIGPEICGEIKKHTVLRRNNELSGMRYQV